MEKQVIIEYFKKSLKSFFKDTVNKDVKYFSDSVSTLNICSTVESILLHGQNTSQFPKIFEKIGRNKHSYNYEFWTIVKEFVPNDFTKQFENQISHLTNVGCSRLWVRYFINEGTILSYLESMINDTKLLNRFYSKDSFIRDDEAMDKFCGLFKSIQHITFNLDLKSPHLNSWSNSDALKLAGFNINPNIVDAVSPPCNNNEYPSTNKQILENEEDILSTSLYHQHTIFESPNVGNLDYVINDNYTDADIVIVNNDTSLNKPDESIIETIVENEFDKDECLEIKSDIQIENSISNTDTFSDELSPFNEPLTYGQHFNEYIDYETEESDKLENMDLNRENSYHNLWSRSRDLNSRISIDRIKVYDYSQESNTNEEYVSNNETTVNNIDDNSGSKEKIKLMDLYPGIQNTTSMDGQNSVFQGVCYKCETKLEIGKCFIDNYNGRLFCKNCESLMKIIIPRDVLKNWDFTPKTVSSSTKDFLSEIFDHPNINLKNNEILFELIPELSLIRNLRLKLSILWMQISSCNIDISESLKKAIFPKDYMLGLISETDLYSLEDLVMLQNGGLEKKLLHVINKIAVPHVTSCSLCRLKARACDKCRDKNRPIFSHDIEQYSHCTSPMCQSVIHNECKSQTILSFYCQRCIQFLKNQEPITLASYDSCN